MREQHYSPQTTSERLIITCLAVIKALSLTSIQYKTAIATRPLYENIFNKKYLLFCCKTASWCYVCKANSFFCFSAAKLSPLAHGKYDLIHLRIDKVYKIGKHSRVVESCKIYYFTICIYEHIASHASLWQGIL